MAKLISNVLKEFIGEIKEYEESNENIPKSNKRASALFIGVLTEDGYLKSYAWDEHDDTGDIINILSNGFLDDIATFEIAKRLHMIKDVDPTLYEEVFLELQNTPFKNYEALGKLLYGFEKQDKQKENGEQITPIVASDDNYDEEAEISKHVC